MEQLADLSVRYLAMNPLQIHILFQKEPVLSGILFLALNWVKN